MNADFLLNLRTQGYRQDGVLTVMPVSLYFQESHVFRDTLENKWMGGSV